MFIFSVEIQCVLQKTLHFFDFRDTMNLPLTYRRRKMTEAEKKDLELSEKLIRMKEENYTRMMIEKDKQDRNILLGFVGSMLALATAAGALWINHVKDHNPIEPVKVQHTNTVTPQKVQNSR